MSLRVVLRIRSRVGKPSTLLQLGTTGGELLYLSAAMDPVVIVAALNRDDVEDLHVALGEWLAEHSARRAPAPLVSGRIAAGLVDAATVQFCTVREAPAEGPRRAPV